MKNFKKIIRNTLLCMLSITIIASYVTPVSAAEVFPESDVAVPIEEYLEPNYDDSHEYFKFSESNKRMDNNGNFTFSFSWSMTSDYFYPKESKITVTATATSSNPDNQKYTISLYKAKDDSFVKSIKYTADGTAYIGTFSDLDTDTLYYLSFTHTHFPSATITGSGAVKPIQL